MNFGLEEGYKADFAELLMILGPYDERSIGVTKGTWSRWHASLLAQTSGGEGVSRPGKIESSPIFCPFNLIASPSSTHRLEMCKELSTDVYPS